MIKKSMRTSRGAAEGNRSGDNVIYSEAFGRERAAYIAGSAAPDDFWREYSEEEAHRRNKDVRLAARRNRQRAVHMNLRYVMYMALLVAAMTASLICYIKLKSDISASNREISSMESTLTELRASNDEMYNQVNGDVDLEEIRRIAVDEYGMKYAAQEQIVVYSKTSGNLVHQIADVSR